MNKKGMLIVVSGPSGVGKDTVVNAFLEQHPQAVPSISATTRAPREHEKEGTHYYFVTEETFQARIAQGDMLEYARYNNHYYGTPKQMVEETRASGKHVVLIIEVQGAQQVMELVPEAVSIFIAPPSLGCLRERLESRGTETEEAIRRRLDTADTELAQAQTYDYIIENCHLDHAVELFSTVITAAEHSPKHHPDILKGVCSPC